MSLLYAHIAESPLQVVGDKFYPGERLEKVEDRLLGGNGSFPLPRLLKLIFIEELGVQKLGKCWKWPQAVGALQVFVTKKRAAQAVSNCDFRCKHHFRQTMNIFPLQPCHYSARDGPRWRLCSWYMPSAVWMMAVGELLLPSSYLDGKLNSGIRYIRDFRKGHDTVPFGPDDAVLVGKIFTHRSPADIQEFVASHQSDLKNISLLFPPSASDKVILSIATTFQLRV
jgi:hypothetical protein